MGPAGSAGRRAARRGLRGGAVRAGQRARPLPRVGAGPPSQRRHPPHRRAGGERHRVLRARHPGVGDRAGCRQRRHHHRDHRLGYRYVGRGAGERQPEARRASGDRRCGLPPHGSVRGEPPGQPARYRGAAASGAQRRYHCRGAAAQRPAHHPGRADASGAHLGAWHHCSGHVRRGDRGVRVVAGSGGSRGQRVGAAYQQRPPVWEPRTTPSGLPKRPDPATRAAQQGQQTPPEHPPSGEDLWDAGWKRSVSRTTSPQPVADRPETPRTETPRPETPRTETPRTESPADTTSTSAIPTVSDSRPSAADTVGSSRTGGQSVYGYSLDRPGQRSAHPLGDTRSSTSERQGWQQNPLSSSYSSGSGRTEQPEVREGYGSTAYLSKRYGPGSGNQNTIIPPSPEHESNEPLPIFDSIESNWFRRRTVRPAVTTTETGPISAVSTPDGLGTEPAAPAQQQSQQPRPEDEWRSAADAGWKTAAERASAPIAGGITASGLPKRIPRANLVRGCPARRTSSRSRRAPRSGCAAGSPVSSRASVRDATP